MKKTTILTPLVIVVIMSMTFSCYRDDSTLDVNKISGVDIDTTGMSTLAVNQFERLVVIPKLDITGLSESNLSYEWRINLELNDSIYQLVGEERNLDFEVRFKPNAADEFYQLFYKVIDHTTALEYSVAWPLTVKNNIGEGLVVAETFDGANTDISHIMSPQVTTGFTEVSVKHNVYSAINGSTISGLIKQMRFVQIFGVDALLAITDNSVVRINTLDYTYGGINDDLFFPSTANYQPQALGGINQTDIYVGNGRLTGTFLGASREFGLPMDFTFSVPDHLGINAFTYSPLPVRVHFYDEVNEHFVYLPTFRFGDTNMYPVPAASGLAFDPSNVKNKINIAASVSTTGDFRHVLKDKTTNELALYVMDGGGDVFPSPIPPAPAALYSLAAAPDIANAVHFVLLEDQKVMYYATSNKIYAMLYSTGTPTFEERYTAPVGEEITTLQVYQQSGYPFDGSDSYIGTNIKQLIMSTYNSTEGKVHLLPITNIGIGNIDISNIETFTGFGRVTAIAAQK